MTAETESSMLNKKLFGAQPLTRTFAGLRVV